MQIAKKTVLTNTARTTLGVDARTVEDALLELHKNDNDNFAIGDVKLSARTISDANWKKCDGSFLRTTVSTDVRKNLTQNTSFKGITATGSDSVEGSMYTDDNYVIIANAGGPSSSSASGTRYASLTIYTIGSNGALTLNSTKTLSSTSTTYRSYQVGTILKCGSYYYVIWRFLNGASDTTKQTIYVSYTTNPTSSWTNKVLVSETSTAGSYYVYLGMYTNNTDVRADFCDSTSSAASVTKTITSLSFTGTISSISTTTQTSAPSVGYASSWNDNREWITASGNGSYTRRGPTGYILYKSSFTANWQSLASPSWANQSGGVSWWRYFVWNNIHWGVFMKSGLTVVAGANSLSDLRTLAVTNLPYYFEINHGYTDFYEYYISGGLTNHGIIGYTVDAEYKVYVWCATNNGVVISNNSVATLPSAPSGMPGCISIGTNYLTGVFRLKSTGTTITYLSALALPNINMNGIFGYMKVATN